jgi:23S rRNA pseudouridine2605 synthase
LNSIADLPKLGESDADRFELEGQGEVPVPEEKPAEKPVRIQVYLARAGIASRRSSETLIAEGRVSVNGRVITAPGEKVLPGDEVRLDGVPVQPESRLRYLALNKPPG